MPRSGLFSLTAETCDKRFRGVLIIFYLQALAGALPRVRFRRGCIRKTLTVVAISVLPGDQDRLGAGSRTSAIQPVGLPAKTNG